MPTNSLTSRFLKPILIAILLLCLCLAALVLLNVGTDFEVRILPGRGLLLPALGLQVLATLLFIYAWHTILQLQSDCRYRFAESSTHIGVTLLGKYLPGKIWGLVGRSYLMTRRGQRSGDALNLLLADQLATFFTGTLIGALALTSLYSLTLAILLAGLGLLALFATVTYYDGVIRWLLQRFAFLTHRFAPGEDGAHAALDRLAFGRAFLVYIAHWLATASVLCVLFYPAISGDLFGGVMVIIAAIPLAMLLGFVAVWAPGGIGVREAAIVAILVLRLPLELAVSIAICYRLICIAIDLVTGVFALAYLARNDSALPAPGQIDT